MNFRLKSLLLAALTAALLLSSCSAGSGLPLGDPLNGTSWSLASIDGAAPISGVDQTLAFADGKASGSGGCNSFGGEYTVSGDGLQFKNLVSTLMACSDPQGVMDDEAAFLSGLTNAQTYELSADKLQITTSDSKTLVFVPQ